MTHLDLNLDPHAPFSTVPYFSVRSDEVEHRGPLRPRQYAAWLGGADVSPSLYWEGAPEGTLSYAITCWDPDAPTGSGYWHWAVFNIPASVSFLPEGAGEPDGGLLPEGAVMLPNESRERRYEGSGPPPGTGVHRYIFVVHALGVERLDLPDGATPAVLGFHVGAQGIGRAILTGTASYEAAPSQGG